MLVIRLQRVGKKNQAMFRLVLTEKQHGPKSGKPKELLGSYNPHQNKVQFDADRIKYWIGNGAQVSDTVHNLLVSNKIIEGKKKNVLSKKTPVAKKAEKVETSTVAEIEKPEEKTEEDTPGSEKPTEEAPVEGSDKEDITTEESKDEKPAE